MKVSEAIERLQSLPKCRLEGELKIPLAENVVGNTPCADIVGFCGDVNLNSNITVVIPSRKIISKYYDRDKPRAMVKDTIDGRKNPNVVRCPECYDIIRKTYRYCPNCGQRLEILNNLERLRNKQVIL